MSTDIKLKNGKTITVKENLSDSQVEDFMREIMPPPDDRDRALDVSMEALRGFNELQKGILSLAQKPEPDYSAVFAGLQKVMADIASAKPQVVDNASLIKALIAAVEKLQPQKQADTVSPLLKVLIEAVRGMGDRELPSPNVVVESPVQVQGTAPVPYEVTLRRDGAGNLKGLRLDPIGG